MNPGYRHDVFLSPYKQTLRIIGKEISRTIRPFLLQATLMLRNALGAETDEFKICVTRMVVKLSQDVMCCDLNEMIDFLGIQSCIPTYQSYLENPQDIEVEAWVDDMAVRGVNWILSQKCLSMNQIIETNNKLKDKVEICDNRRAKEYYEGDLKSLRYTGKQRKKNEDVEDEIKILANKVEESEEEDDLIEEDEKEENYDTKKRPRPKNEFNVKPVTKPIFGVYYSKKEKKKLKEKKVYISNSGWNKLVKEFNAYATYNMKITRLRYGTEGKPVTNVLISEKKIPTKNGNYFKWNNEWIIYPNNHSIMEFMDNHGNMMNVFQRMTNYDQEIYLAKTQTYWNYLQYDRGKVKIKDHFRSEFKYVGFLKLDQQNLMNYN
jgi:hypothetical protein